MAGPADNRYKSQVGCLSKARVTYNEEFICSVLPAIKPEYAENPMRIDNVFLETGRQGSTRTGIVSSTATLYTDLFVFLFFLFLSCQHRNSQIKCFSGTLE